jgi:hypothetical protein
MILRGSNSIACYREIFRERKSQLIRQTSFVSYFNKFPQPPQTFSNHYPDQSAAINIKATPYGSKKIMTR